MVVTETRAPAGFILDTQSQTVQIKEGRTVSLTFKNQPKGAIIIQKRDSATGQPLSGAEFRVTTAAGCEVGLDGVIGTSTLTQNGIFTTDAQGEIKITNLAPGAYVLTELKAPTGYVMDRASTNVVIGQGGDTQTVVVTNSKAGTLVIDKRDALTGKPLQGVTFKVTTSTGEYVPDASGHISSNGLYFTDKDGKITINGVVGTLVVTETATIPGYTIDEATRTQTVVVNPNDTQTLHFTNTPSTTLVIEKYIEGTTTPLKGVTFLVTDSSGAVVGMDVVKSGVESLGGSVSITSEQGKGMTTIMRIPLTMAIMDGMEVSVGNSIFTIPINNIRSSIKLTEADILHDSVNGEMVKMLDGYYPVIRAKDFYNLPSGAEKMENGILMWLESGDCSYCLFVDELLGEQQIVVKPLPAYVNNFDIKNYGITGCSILGDGNISIILDAGGLYAAARNS